jgi:hypothetical protein
MNTRAVSLCFAIILWFSLSVVSLNAATQNGVVTGLVLDQRGSPIVGATVTLVNASIGFSQQQATDVGGTYTFLEVKPTDGYVLIAKSAGFDPEVTSAFEVTVNDLYLVRPPISMAPPEIQQAQTPTPSPQVPVEAKAARAQTEKKPTAPAAIRKEKPLIARPGLPPDMSTTVSGVIDSDAVHTLPLADRDFIGLALLAPGTYPVEQGSALAGASLVVNGVRANMNNFLLDGADNNDYTINQSLPFQIVEAMQEFRVQASTSTAEFGRNAGAQINVVSRSGSNAYHGTLFAFNRNSYLSADNALSTYSGGTFDGFAQEARIFQIEAPQGPQGGLPNGLFPTPILSDPVLSSIFQKGTYVPLNQNQFGANFGGPIVKNKAFFFFNYEGFRADDPRPLMERVPDTDSRLATNCFGFPCNPQVQALLNLYPDPNVPKSALQNGVGYSVSDPTSADFEVGSGAFYTGRSRNYTDSDNYLGRVDVQPTSRAALSFKYNIQNVDQDQGGAVEQTATNPGSGVYLNGRNQNFSFNYVQNISPRTVNQARVGWNRFQLGTLPLDHTLDASTATQLTNLNFSNEGLPSILMGGFQLTIGPYANLGAPFNSPSSRTDTVYSFADNFSHTWGRHVFEAGGEFRRDHLDVDNEAAGRGLMGITTVPNGLAFGVAELASIARVSPAFGGSFARTFDANAFDWFLQDTWRPSSNVSMNFGVRHEINQAPVEAHNLLVNDYPGACTDPNPINGFSPVCLIPAGSNQMLNSDGTSLGTSKFTAPDAGFETDFRNFAPHVGFVWSPSAHNGKTVLRGGYAMAFDQEPIEPSVNMLLNPPYVQQTASFLPTLGTIFPSLPYQSGFPVPGTCVDNGSGLCWFPQPYSITARDPNTRTSYVYQYHMGVEEQIGQRAVFELAYVGSGGRKLPDNRLLLECTQSVFLNNPLGCFPPVIQGFPGLGGFTDSVVFQENHANSNFNSLQARLDTRAFHHFTFHMQYQWSHSIDNASSTVAPVFLLSPASAGLLSYVLGGVNIDGIPFPLTADQLAVANNVNPALSLRPGLPTITTGDLLPNDTTNNANLSGERGNSNFDVRHRFVASYVFDVPSWSRAGRVLSGWQLAGITVAQTGQPFSVYGDFFGAPLRPSEVATPHINNRNPNGAIDNAIPAGCGVSYPVNQQNMVLPCPGGPNSSFSTTSIGVFEAGSLGRNAFYGPNLVNFDFSVLKNTYFSEGKNIQFRAEFFNLFNRANFLQPISQVGQFAPYTLVSNPFFGQILQARSARQIQFALKFAF